MKISLINNYLKSEKNIKMRNTLHRNNLHRLSIFIQM